MSRDPAQYLEDMVAAAEAIQQFVSDVAFEAFAAILEKRSAVERQVFIIGEAAARLPEHLRRDDAPVPWRAVIGLRNLLAHGYWTIDGGELWQVATVHVPKLATHVRTLLNEQ